MATKPKTQIMSHDDTVMSPITKASNVLFEDGKTAQDKLEDNVEKSFTPSVENSSSMFKVGQGDNVDYSGNVVDGAYVSCVLKGRTLVNCIQEPSSQDVILPYDFTEGQYVTINDTKESGALGVELKGQTLVNLKPNKPLGGWANSTYDTSSGICTLNGLNAGIKFDMGLLKTSTEYLVVFDILELPTFAIENDNPIKLTLGNSNYDYVNIHKSEFKIGVLKKVVTTPNNFIESIALGNRGEFATPMKLRFMIIEYQQGMENWDIPYFEGMTSVKAPTVKTVGKNLFDIKNAEELSGWGQHGFELLSNGVAFHARSGWNAIGYRFPSLRNKTVTVTADVTLNVLTNNKNLTQECGIGNKAYIPQKTLSNNTTERVATTFTLGGDGIVWLFGSSSPENTGYGSSDVKWSFTNIQVEEGSTATTYEPHTSSSLTIPNEVVLRSLPNGVCDTFNTRTGEYVRRVGEKTLNGSESWGVWQQGGDHLTQKTVVGFGLNLEDAPTTKSFYVLCDRFATGGTTSGADNDHSYYVYHKELIYGYYANASTYRRLGLSVSKTKLGIPNDNTDATQALVSLRAYLASNPIKVQYELATPIITKLPLQSTLKPWNTTTHIYTEIPQNSLYPILSHSNPTYPVILKPSTKYSIVANSCSNNHTNSPINFNLGGATASATVGNRVTTVTTPSTLSNDLLTMSGRGNKLNNVMVIEGEVVGDEPYFEGICDVKSPVVKNVGKNLFNTKEFTDDRYIANTGAMLKDNNSVDRNASPYIKVRPKTAYIFSGMTRSGVTNGGRNVYYCEYDSNKNIVGVRNVSVANPYILTTTQNTAYIRTTVKDEDLQTCVMEEASTPTAYEPHKSNTFMPIINDADVLTLTQDMFEQGNVAYNNAAMGSSYESMKESSTIRLRLKELIKVNPNSSYRVTVNDGYVVYFRPFDKNKRKLSNVDIDNPIFRDSDYTTDSRTHYISVFVRKVNDVATITLDEFNATGLGGSKEAGKIIVLRSLPNGVCDTFNTRTGEYVRRIGKIVFNGSEDIAWSPSSYSSANHYAFFTRSLSSAKNNISRPHCDKLPSIESLTEAQRDREGCMISSDGRGYGNFWIKLSSTKIENNVLSLKTYLKQNPITVQYELATPVVSTVDVQGFPYAYKGGHVQLSSSHTSQSLTPKVEYSLPINRNGQIRMNQAMVERHQKHIDKLQAIILANLVNNQYKQTLATLQYELSRV